MSNNENSNKMTLKNRSSKKREYYAISNNIDITTTFNNLSKINYDVLNEKLNSAFNSLNQINYNALNEKLNSAFNTLSQINYNALNKKLNSAFNGLNQINYNALNEKLNSDFNSLNQINYNALNEKLNSAFNSLNQINYNALNEKLNSDFNSLNQINYNALNEKLSSAFNSLNQINYNVLNEKLISAFDKLNNSTLYSWVDNIYDHLDTNSYSTFTENIQNIAPAITLEDFEIDDNTLINDSATHLSDSFIAKLFTGTLSYDDDIKNNKLAAFILIIVFWFVSSLISFILEDGYTYAKNYFLNNFLNVKEVITAEDYKNYRIVITDILNVRKQPSTNSDIIGKLYYLNVIKIIDSKPYWLKVEYIDTENNVRLTGWISKKYTKDFSEETY